MSDVDDAGPICLLNGADVDRLASVSLALDAAEAAARLDRGRVATGRLQVNGAVSWSRILSGSITELDVFGYKEFHRVGKRVRYHIHLYRESTGNALGIVDGRRITSLRTAATAAVAVQAWGSRVPVSVGVVGSGEEAREGLRALHGAIDISDVSVYSPTQANREAFAIDMSQSLGLDVQAADDQTSVLKNADVLYVATSSKGEPFLSRRDVEGIPMVVAVGATQPADRELAADVFGGAEVVVDVLDAVLESGDGRAAMEHGWDPGSARTLGDYLDAPTPADRTLFKSIGTVEQDLVLALALLDAAERQGIGTVTGPVGSLRVMR
jgi:ornithine cyclodeaminase/alanine dehydrogenase-like protein (mu-crystallin family)